MKRLRRILLNTLTAISLLLAIATAGLWLRSYFARDDINLWSSEYQLDRSEVTQRSLIWGRGQIRMDYRWDLFCGRWSDRLPVAPGFRVESSSPYRTIANTRGRPVDFEWGGFLFDIDRESVAWGDGRGFWSTNMIAVAPMWLPLLLFVALSILFFLRQSKRISVSPGRCPACGYDMRANPAKCSECGHEMRLAGDNGDARG